VRIIHFQKPISIFPDAVNGFANKYISIPHPFIDIPHGQSFLLPTDNISSDAEGDSENVCTYTEGTAVLIHIYGSPY
jgi:hypothetical protein